MLGENHALIADFPEMKDTIAALVGNDPSFAQAMKDYNALDKEIRVLELNGSPIGDDAMMQLKYNRAELKDALYQRLSGS
ncbi:YdcH family protein [Vibrio scophthalmi]|uniref:DUF465 domain-containing protein n=1 Tax=Vibrio scophthalmi TaxID=45658 RepID=A0A1C7FGA9_9VIBR|nr:YdcH family protein [Vibrio scophthalmi]ANU38374.1 hypothetical protein VSVS05_03336 [Vibrio scophthalmi]